MSDDKIAEAFASAAEVSEAAYAFGQRYSEEERRRAMAFYAGVEWALTDADAPRLMKLAFDRLKAANAVMRGLVGPRCPKCVRFILAEHVRWGSARSSQFVAVSPACMVTDEELRSRWPEIARELAL